jgi:WD40 repeat protein
MHLTRGHVSEVTSCAWHPKDPKVFITSSADSTIRYVFCHCGGQFIHTECRIWDVDNKRKQKTVIVVKSKERGARTKVLTCSYSPDGNLIGGGASFTLRNRYLISQPFIACLDGALHMWQTSSNFVRPNMTIENAHVKGTETGSLVFSVDRQTVLTRGGDDTVKRK